VLHRLRMSAELGDWLAEICSSETVTAREVGAALAAVMGEADPADLAFVTDLAAQPGGAYDPADPCEAADYDYQALLESLQLLRRQVADAGSFRHSNRVRITKAGSEPWPFTDAELAAAEAQERKLAERAGLSLAELASQTGMAEAELWRLESGGFRTASMADVATYVRGLGGGFTVHKDGQDARTVLVD
jgi:hypothetical protein